MKKIVMALAAGLVSTMAFAADLPSRKSAPIFVEASTSGFFAGIRGGYGINSHNPTFGVNAGYDFEIGRVELNYDRLGVKNGANLFTANAIAQYNFGSFTPYALAGVGFANVNKNIWSFPNYNTAVWNVGAGMRYAFTPNIALDLRYRYVQGFSSYTALPVSGGRMREHLWTGGLEYRF